MIKAIIIDDEARGIDALAELINNYCPEITVSDSATDIITGAELIRNRKPDVVFLDIEMPEGNGFQLLEQFDHIDFDVVFVTAYNDYAIRALRFSALDYLLKPVSITELKETVKRLKDHKESAAGNKRLQYLKQTLEEGNPFHKIVLSTQTGYYFIKVADIIYCEASENYTHFYMEGNLKYTASRPLKEFAQLFEKHHFFRIHKSYLINLGQVSFVNKDSLVSMSNRAELPVSHRKRTEFFELLKELNSI
jgi:two-component system LytT family response regulator